MSKTEEYVDVRTGAELLGVTQHKFFYHVDRGEIEIQPGTERKNRRYKVSDILKVKDRLRTKKRKPSPVLIDWLYAADVPAGLKLSQQLYSEEIDLAEAAVYQSWRRNNPYLTMAAFSPDRSECYASVQVVPLVSEQIILDVLSNKREESSILPDDILAYDKTGPYNLLVTSATCLPDRPHLLYSVLHKYMDYWISMYPERHIKRVYAQATESGMRIVQHFFMAPRPDLAYNAFMLDLAWPATARMIKTFKERLAEIAPLPPDLHWPPIETQQESTSLPKPDPPTA